MTTVTISKAELHRLEGYKFAFEDFDKHTKRARDLLKAHATAPTLGKNYLEASLDVIEHLQRKVSAFEGQRKRALQLLREARTMHELSPTEAADLRHSISAFFLTLSENDLEVGA